LLCWVLDIFVFHILELWSKLMLNFLVL
jgi:hypothetical protein